MTQTTTGADLFRAKTQTRIFNLPKLADAKPKFEIPNFTIESISGCANCKKAISKTDGDFCQSVKVCRACLLIYSTVENALNVRAEQRAMSPIRERFIQKFKEVAG